MELILLSGNGAHTKEWIESVEKEMKELFDSTHIQYYRHWESGEKMIDLESELEILDNYLRNKKDYVIFAKSAGAVLALKGIFERRIFPKKCMFAGVAVLWGDSMNFKVRDWMKTYGTQTYFIQKSLDPAMNALDLKELIEKSNVKNSKMIEISGDDHNYDDIGELKNLMKELIAE